MSAANNDKHRLQKTHTSATVNKFVITYMGETKNINTDKQIVTLCGLASLKQI